MLNLVVRSVLVALSIVLVYGTMSLFAAEPDGEAFRAGFAERDITPEIGMEQPGGYGKAYHRTVHDPCKVRAAVFDDGKKRVALVGLDALVIRRPTVMAARKAIQKQCGIEPEAVMIGASHSHSSGPTGMILPGEYDHGSELVRSLAYEKSSCADAEYLKRVEAEIVAAVCAADAARGPVRCGVGSGTESTVAFNRRFRMKDGLTFTHPGKGNPEIVEVAGPTDPEVGVIGVWGEDGKLLGCVVNFACHATTSPGGTSANYIYYIEQAVRGFFGTEVVVVFLNGASGDVTQVDNLDLHVNPQREQWAKRVGGCVGAEAVKVLLKMTPGMPAPIDAKSSVLSFERRKPSAARLARCLEIVEKTPKDIGPADWTFAKEIVLLDALLAKEPEKEAEVQAIQIGPAVFISDPAEYFCQFGLDLKKGSPFVWTFPVSTANGCVGYVPTEEALGPNGGGYETRLTSYSNLEPTAGRKMVEVGLELTREMTPGTPIEPPRAPTFRASWSYGSVPPELE